MFTVGAAEKERLPAIAMERKRSFIVTMVRCKIKPFAAHDS
jgi:hypothetical protein